MHAYKFSFSGKLVPTETRSLPQRNHASIKNHPKLVPTETQSLPQRNHESIKNHPLIMETIVEVVPYRSMFKLSESRASIFLWDIKLSFVSIINCENIGDSREPNPRLLPKSNSIS